MRNLLSVAVILLSGSGISLASPQGAQQKGQLEAISSSQNAIPEAKHAWFARAVSDILNGSKAHERGAATPPASSNN